MKDGLLVQKLMAQEWLSARLSLAQQVLRHAGLSVALETSGQVSKDPLFSYTNA